MWSAKTTTIEDPLSLHLSIATVPVAAASAYLVYLYVETCIGNAVVQCTDALANGPTFKKLSDVR